MAALEGEAQSSILHEHAGAFADNAAAEVLIERVDEAAGVTVAVDDRERDGVAIRDQRALAWGRQFAKRALVVDEPRESSEVIGGDEAADRRLLPARVGEEGVAVAIGEARGLDVPVEARRRRPARRSVAPSASSSPRIMSATRPGPFGGHCQTSSPRHRSEIGSTNSAPLSPLAKSSSVCTPPAALSVAAMSAATGPS